MTQPHFEELAPAEAPIFHLRIREAKRAHPYGAAVDVHSKSDYGNMRTFLTRDGMAGYAVNKEGELNSVFNHPDSPYKNVAGHAAEHATLVAGGTHGSAFEDLPAKYAKGGAQKTGELDWNEEYKPSGWKTSKIGRPNVGFVALGPKANKGQADVVKADDYDSGMARAKQIGEERTAKLRRTGAFTDGHNGAKG